MEIRTAKDLVQVLVQLEPVRQHTEHEQEDGKTEQQEARKDTGREPDLTRLRRYEAVLGKTGSVKRGSACS